ncbi:MAG: branched chain amino acid aminotransferase, partial [Actinobacteria bacterium]|nr:branched chain amino acid aminotransferase [Actinomycetota bacterium]
MSVKLTPSSHAVAEKERAEKVANPGFGKYYTDHMVVAEWTEADGWGQAELKAYAPISLDPAAMVFHYGQEIFEGLKAYRQPDGSIALFRPEANAARFARSANRLALPEMPDQLFLDTVHALVKQDGGWVPDKIGESLYLRPFMFATEVGLGVRPSNRALYMLIATPAAQYFNPANAVAVWI